MEIDNFSCSHRCLLTEVIVVRGASVLVTPSRPATLLLYLLRPLSLLTSPSIQSLTCVVRIIVFL
jgi:hypothetical protein